MRKHYLCLSAIIFLAVTYASAGPLSTAAVKHARLTASSSAKAKVAFLMPKATFVATSGQVNLGTGTVSIEEAAGRVLPRLVSEAEKIKWTEVEIVPFADSLSAQNAEEPSIDGTPVSILRALKAIGKRLEVQYIVTSLVTELTSYRASSFPLPRKGGRATVKFLIYDTVADKYVFEAIKTATSSKAQIFAGESLGAMQDQALFNAYNQGLTPFFVEGKRVEIATVSTDLLATVRSPGKDGKGILLDLGTTSGVRVGDQFESLDGTTVIKVIQVLSNGSIGEVVKGTAEKDMVLKSSK